MNNNFPLNIGLSVKEAATQKLISDFIEAVNKLGKERAEHRLYCLIAHDLEANTSQIIGEFNSLVDCKLDSDPE